MLLLGAKTNQSSVHPVEHVSLSSDLPASMHYRIVRRFLVPNGATSLAVVLVLPGDMLM